MQKFKIYFALEQEVRYITIRPLPGENLYLMLKTQIEEFLGHKKFELTWKDGGVNDGGDNVACTSDKDLQEALEYRQRPTTQSGESASPVDTTSRNYLTLYVKTKNAKKEANLRAAETKPEKELESGGISVIDPAGETESMGFHSWDSIAFLKKVYSGARGIPVEEMKVQLNGKILTDKQTVRSVQNHAGRVHVTWDSRLDADNPPIQLRVRDQHDQEIQFTIHMKSSFDWMMRKYYWRNRKTPGSLRFTYDGVRLQEAETPASRDMEDGDVIEVYEPQHGGNLLLRQVRTG